MSPSLNDIRVFVDFVCIFLKGDKTQHSYKIRLVSKSPEEIMKKVTATQTHTHMNGIKLI